MTLVVKSDCHFNLAAATTSAMQQPPNRSLHTLLVGPLQTLQFLHEDTINHPDDDRHNGRASELLHTQIIETETERRLPKRVSIAELQSHSTTCW
ncbi:hypothetical protein PF008_g15053 [Phytophthora fragariae]|uniref:Uncharacterized protein n=1 Tax=Phytophthora fragariae TaxID=53985 RepID=A0A6G0RF70_9STRA|nr:hypothetical protein PF008_g15053 [Phytophthora fragariae]